MIIRKKFTRIITNCFIVFSMLLMCLFFSYHTCIEEIHHSALHPKFVKNHKEEHCFCYGCYFSLNDLDNERYFVDLKHIFVLDYSFLPSFLPFASQLIFKLPATRASPRV
ncbi:MAG: hypothetical protein QMD92_05595 [bacterium]|nr:hypothetical protein [bacterium]